MEAWDLSLMDNSEARREEIAYIQDRTYHQKQVQEGLHNG
jgi:hypothetical protein